MQPVEFAVCTFQYSFHKMNVIVIYEQNNADMGLADTKFSAIMSAMYDICN